MKTKNTAMLPLIFIVVSLIALILINALAIWIAVKDWTAFPEWGWSLPLKEQAGILILCAMVTSVVAFFVTKHFKSRKMLGATILMVLFIVTLSALVSPLAFPFSPPPQEETLRRLGITPETLMVMPPCEKVEKFAEAGYPYLELYNTLAVSLPDWFHQSLSAVPKDILADCIKGEVTKQLQYIHGDSQERQVATQKIYALLFETWKLDLLNNPTISEIENVVVCQRRIDNYWGRISLLYYIGFHGDPPAYNYFSEEGKGRLFSDVCTH